MALTDDQRALLQLLLEGGQGYDDIASLLGIPNDEVRSRARAALQEIGGADPDGQVALSDYLLGQADPIGRADAVRHLQNDPEANALADRLVTQLRVLAPKAQLPEIPAARGGRRAAPPPAPTPPAAEPSAPGPAPAAPAPPGPSGPGFTERLRGLIGRLPGGGERRTRIAIALAAGLALVVAIVVITTGGGSGGDDGGGGGGSDCETVDAAAAQQAGASVIPLEAASSPEGECEPSGQVTLTATKKQVGFQVNAVELQPTSEGESYVLWLYRTDDQSLPIAQSASQDGNLTLSVPLPQQVAALIVGGAFASVRLSLASASEVQTLQQQGQAQSQQGALPGFIGANVLEGALPQPPPSSQGGAGAGTGTVPPAGGGAQGGTGTAPPSGTGQ